MSRFQPSRHNSAVRYNYDLTGYGDANSDYQDALLRQARPEDYEHFSRTATTTVRDFPGGEFVVSSEGTVKVLATGVTYKTGTDPGATMIKHLTEVPGNKAKIDSVLSSSDLSTALAASKIKVTPQQIVSGGASAPVIAAAPFYQHRFFIPAVIAGGTVAVIVAILAVNRR